MVRAAVKIVLMQEGFKRIYEAACGKEVLPKIREHKPDLVILDLLMPSLDGLDVLARIKTSGVPCRVLVFTSQEPMFYQDRCMHAGAAGFIAKSNDLQHLHRSVHAVMAGYTYFAQLPSASVALNTIQLSEKQMIDKLSDRELTILQYLCRGFSNKAIAECTHLSLSLIHISEPTRPY